MRWENKQEILEQVQLSPEGMASIQDCETPRKAIEGLQSQACFEDAVRLIAGVLPLNEAIRWCGMSLDAHGIGIDASVRGVVQAWLDKPNEEHRIQVAENLTWDEPASPWTWLRAAISWTGGSLAPPDSTVIPPPKRMVVSSTIAALQLASCQSD